MARKLASVLLCVLFAGAATGCFSKKGIGVSQDVVKQEFKVGTTTKAEVVEAIGLPQASSKDADGTEHLWFERDSRLTGMCLGCGNVGQVSGLIPAAIVASDQDKQRTNAVEFVFDPAGVLTAIKAPPEPKKPAPRKR